MSDIDDWRKIQKKDWNKLTDYTRFLKIEWVILMTDIGFKKKRLSHINNQYKIFRNEMSHVDDWH